MTPAEERLWFALRGGKIAGLHFRRQQVIGNYIADFYCESARLVIELDGSSHELRWQIDRHRDAAIRALGVRVLRIPNEIVRGDLDILAAWIAEHAAPRVGTKNRPDPRPVRALKGEPNIPRVRRQAGN